LPAAVFLAVLLDSVWFAVFFRVDARTDAAFVACAAGAVRFAADFDALVRVDAESALDAVPAARLAVLDCLPADLRVVGVDLAVMSSS
jgi:hypothetical protein